MFYVILVTLAFEVITISAIDLPAQSPSLNFTQLTSQNGYRYEEHTVVTEDGYILTIFRLIQPFSCPEKNSTKPILLIHGYVLSADAWLISGRADGLGFLIADLCRDLWLGNFRGTTYSRQHVSLDPNTNGNFWNFSLTEIGRYDFPAMIDYVLEATGAEDLTFIGYSQGGGCFYVMCSERPEYNDKVNLMIALSPSSRLLNTQNLALKSILAYGEIRQEGLGIGGEMLHIGSLLQRSLERLCLISLTLCDIAKDTFHIKYSFHPGFVSDETLRRLFRVFPAGTSVKNTAHFGQLTRSTEYRQYDYGPSANLAVYGSATPPSYNMSAVTTPVVILYGLNDGIIDTNDIAWLATQLPNVLEVYQVTEPLWAHFDYFSSIYLRDLVFPKVREYLLRYSQA